MRANTKLIRDMKRRTVAGRGGLDRQLALVVEKSVEDAIQKVEDVLKKYTVKKKRKVTDDA